MHVWVLAWSTIATAYASAGVLNNAARTVQQRAVPAPQASSAAAQAVVGRRRAGRANRGRDQYASRCFGPSNCEAWPSGCGSEGVKQCFRDFQQVCRSTESRQVYARYGASPALDVASMLNETVGVLSGDLAHSDRRTRCEDHVIPTQQKERSSALRRISALRRRSQPWVRHKKLGAGYDRLESRRLIQIPTTASWTFQMR